jgi:hypothetical protein
MIKSETTAGVPSGYHIDITQMDWGEWRASAIKDDVDFHRIASPDGGKGWGINDDCLPIDGPYRDTKDQAVSALLEQLKNFMPLQ